MLRKVINKILGKHHVNESGQEFLIVEMDVDKYHNKGVKYLDARKYEKAIEMFKKEIECDSEGSLGYHFLGQTLQAMGKTDEARKNYEIALKNAHQMYRRHPDDFDKEIIDEIEKDVTTLGEQKDSNPV